LIGLMTKDDSISFKNITFLPMEKPILDPSTNTQVDSIILT